MAATTSPGNTGATGYSRSRRYEMRSRGSEAARRLSSTVASSKSASDWNDRLSPALALRTGTDANQFDAVEEHASGLCRCEARNGIDGRCLARAVGPDEADDLARCDRERKVVDCDHAAVSDRNALDLQHLGPWGGLASRWATPETRVRAAGSRRSLDRSAPPIRLSWLDRLPAMPSWFWSTSRTTTAPPMSSMYLVRLENTAVGELSAE